MLLKTFMEIVNYRITEGSDYQWSCFGPNAYMLDSWDGLHENGHSLCITFDTRTQVVYSVEACDYMHNRAYRLINPAYKDKHDAEVKARGLADEAWEDDEGNPVIWCDLELEEDFEEKARAIVAGLDYENTVSIPLDLPDDLLLTAAMNAHKQDITLNEYINNALREMINEYNRDPTGVMARADLLKSENC